MYPYILAIHNLVRWVAFILGIVAFALALSGWLGKREWTERQRKLGSYFAIAMDTQFLLGLLLYFIWSPITRTMFQNFSAAMQSNDVRFFGLEHVTYMILALVFAHLGSILPRKVSEPLAKYKRATIFFGIAVLLLILGMPWGRPLLPHF